MNLSSILSGVILLKSIDLSFVKVKSYTGGFMQFEKLWPFDNNDAATGAVLEYVRYGTDWFDGLVANRWPNTLNKDVLCKLPSLNAQTFVDLAEDLPDISLNSEISNYSKTLCFGQTNFNDYTKFPQSVRDKITAKGWIIAI